MSVKGIRQLKNLKIRYSDLDGSSKGVREWIRETLIPFAEKNPDLQIRTELKRARHPFLSGEYVNGNMKTIGIKNLSVEEIDDYIMDLRNQVGRKVRHIILDIGIN
jgi:large subunit ribosomal protein L43